jgi:hypothetical protein
MTGQFPGEYRPPQTTRNQLPRLAHDDIGVWEGVPLFYQVHKSICIIADPIPQV